MKIYDVKLTWKSVWKFSKPFEFQCKQVEIITKWFKKMCNEKYGWNRNTYNTLLHLDCSPIIVRFNHDFIVSSSVMCASPTNGICWAKCMKILVDRGCWGYEQSRMLVDRVAECEGKPDYVRSKVSCTRLSGIR